MTRTVEDDRLPMLPENVTLLSLAYPLRQRIVILDDAIVEAERTAKAMDKKKYGNWQDMMLDVVLKGLRGGLFGPIAAIDTIIDTVTGVMKLFQDGVPVLMVGQTEAANLRFPLGHPRPQILYIGHPADPCRYFPAAEFHRKVFEHKFAEVQRLLTYLGATYIEAEHISGWTKEYIIDGKATLPVNSGLELSGEGGSKSTKGSNLTYKATLDGIEPPSIPENLVWYEDEDTWKAMAEQRLHAGLLEFDLVLKYTDDLGVNTGLKLSIAKVGIDMGGKFEEHQSTIWRLKGKFKKAEGVGSPKE